MHFYLFFPFLSFTCSERVFFEGFLFIIIIILQPPFYASSFHHLYYSRSFFLLLLQLSSVLSFVINRGCRSTCRLTSFFLHSLSLSKLLCPQRDLRNYSQALCCICMVRSAVLHCASVMMMMMTCSTRTLPFCFCPPAWCCYCFGSCW